MARIIPTSIWLEMKQDWYCSLQVLGLTSRDDYYFNWQVILMKKSSSFTSPFGRIFCSSSLKAVPIFRLTVGGSSPGSRGYSLGSFPVSS